MSQITFLDRMVAWAAPETGLKRALARRSFEALAARTRGYDGAAKGRRTDGWKAAGASADAEIAAASGLLRDRMRDLTRNNPHAAKAVSVLVNNIIGSGIIPRAATGDARLDETVDRLWTEWSAACDADGQLDIFGLQTLAVREMIEAGEVLIRRRPRRPSDGLAVPLQVQIIEADLLDNTRNGDLTDGGRLLQGIEFDPLGRRRAYWLHAQHPGDAVVTMRGRLESLAIPASEVLHLYEKQRTQVRGVPWGTPVMRSLRDLDDWTQAELVRKKTEACVVGIVLGADEADLGLAPSVVDADGNRVEQFEPGLIAYARGGKDIRFNQPATTAGVGEWLRAQLHIVAAGFRMPYELLTGDLSQVNYSSIRAGLVEFRRLIDAVQWQIVIPVLCQPMWVWFCQAAWAAGKLPRSADKFMQSAQKLDCCIAVEWSPPRFEAVDPLKDAMADLLSLRSGTMSLAQAIARQGHNPDAVLAEIAAMNAKIDALGLIFDSDPRRVTKTGVMQADTTGQPNNPDT